MNRLKLDIDRLHPKARGLINREYKRDWQDTFWWNHFAIHQFREDLIKRLNNELRDLHSKWTTFAYQCTHGHVKETTRSKYRSRHDSRVNSIMRNIEEIHRGEWDELAKPNEEGIELDG